MSSKRSVLIGCGAVLLLSGLALAQTHVGATPETPATNFTDTSILKPPPGDKVAVLEWEDLECPACAHAFPMVHAAIAEQHVPLIERDFLIPGHVWSPMAALYARYLHDRLSPQLAVEYRREVFASQNRIASGEDLQHFTQEFFRRNGKQMPFVVDPGGKLKREIEADVDLGRKVGLAHTPTIVVVTPNHWTEVLDPAQIGTVIAEAKRSSSPK